MLQEARSVLSFTSGRTFDEYLEDLMLRSAVERQVEIVGEALRQMLAQSPELEAELASGGVATPANATP